MFRWCVDKKRKKKNSSRNRVDTLTKSFLFVFTREGIEQKTHSHGNCVYMAERRREEKCEESESEVGCVRE